MKRAVDTASSARTRCFPFAAAGHPQGSPACSHRNSALAVGPLTNETALPPRGPASQSLGYLSSGNCLPDRVRQLPACPQDHQHLFIKCADCLDDLLRSSVEERWQFLEGQGIEFANTHDSVDRQRNLPVAEAKRNQPARRAIRSPEKIA